MGFHKILFAFNLSLCICFAWGSPPLTIDFLLVTQAASPYFTVTNTNNTTQIFVKTYSGQNILLWQHTPIADADTYMARFRGQKKGDLIDFSYEDDSKKNFPIYTIVIDLKSNQVTKPSYTFSDFNSQGIGAYTDPHSPYTLLVTPIFSPCLHPKLIPLDQSFLNRKGLYGFNATFNNDNDLEIDYIDQGGVISEDIVKISTPEILKECVGTQP